MDLEIFGEGVSILAGGNWLGFIVGIFRVWDEIRECGCQHFGRLGCALTNCLILRIEA